MRRWKSAILGLVVGLAGPACGDDGDFMCSQDADCSTDVGTGRCEANGFCSFEDVTCESGRRYSDHAGSLSKMCVPLSADTETTGSSSMSTSSTADASASSSETSTGSTTDPVASTTDTSGPIPDDECGFGKTLTVDRTAISPVGALDDFPMLLQLTDPEIFDHSDGSDFVVEDAAGTQLPIEVDTLDPASGLVQAWVRLASWDDASSLRLRFGDGAPAPLPRSDVWDGSTLAVHHFSEFPGTSEDVPDSTSNGFDARASGGAAAQNPVAVGGAALFNRDGLLLQENPFVGMLSSVTVSAWVAVPMEASATLFANLNGAQTLGCQRFCTGNSCVLSGRPNSVNAHGEIWCTVPLAPDGFTSVRAETEADLIGNDQPTHFAFTWDADAGQARVYVDGVPVATASGEDGALLHAASPPARLGPTIGRIDELRISSMARDPTWIAAQRQTVLNAGEAITASTAVVPVPCDGS